MDIKVGTGSDMEIINLKLIASTIEVAGKYAFMIAESFNEEHCAYQEFEENIHIKIYGYCDYKIEMNFIAPLKFGIEMNKSIMQSDSEITGVEYAVDTFREFVNVVVGDFMLQACNGDRIYSLSIPVVKMVTKSEIAEMDDLDIPAVICGGYPIHVSVKYKY